MGRFRTPSLRNVAAVAPYMLDGSVATLRDAIRHYAAGGRAIADGPRAGRGRDKPWEDSLLIGIDATGAEIDDLIAFLESPTDRAFLFDPAFADPWPADHPVARRLPALLDRKDDPS